jgi:hypothetical protein
MNELLKQFDGVKSFTTGWSWKTAYGWQIF